MPVPWGIHGSGCATYSSTTDPQALPSGASRTSKESARGRASSSVTIAEFSNRNTVCIWRFVENRGQRYWCRGRQTSAALWKR